MAMPFRRVKPPTLPSMLHTFSGALLRLHSPLNLRTLDRLTTVIGGAFAALGLPLLYDGQHAAGVVASLGGVLIVVHGMRERRRYDVMAWTLAVVDPDPVRALALYEYLYRLPFREVLVLSEWRTERERDGLPVIVDDCDAPPEVRALWTYLHSNPREFDH